MTVPAPTRDFAECLADLIADYRNSGALDDRQICRVLRRVETQLWHQGRVDPTGPSSARETNR